MTNIKIAGAPISWGVCEAPNWGFQMSQGRVLDEMREVGYTACEFGPVGFLPEAAEERAAFLAEHGLTAVGGFLPVVLHDPNHDIEPELRAELEVFQRAGAEVLVLAASTGLDGYDEKPILEDEGWDTLIANLDKAVALAAEYGVLAVIHPHVGTMIENKYDVERVVAESEIGFCLDTGHMMIGGTDPVWFAKTYPDRVKHAHLKDVRADVAKRAISRELSYYDAVVAGLYTPLGQGDVEIDIIVNSMLDAGYDGWFVLEQDSVVPVNPAEGAGPIADSAASVAYLRELIAQR
ncbi:MAG: sugar phosphate isomerase/epimerase family protein [Microbacteriaceae bacterium]